MLRNFVLVLPFLLGTWAIDNTLLPETKGEDVVCAAIDKIEKSGIFFDDQKMLRRIAYVESKFGVDRGTYRDGYHGGIWQVDKIRFDDAMISGSHPELDKLWPKIEKMLLKRKEDITWEDLRKPLFSGVFARIRLYLVNIDLPKPDDLVGQGKYWKSHYNSELGKGTVDDFVNRVTEMKKQFRIDCNMCQGRMDLAIVMDGSKDLGTRNHFHAIQTAQDLIGLFSITSVDVGYIMFSDTPEVIFPLKSGLTRDQMKAKIDKTRNFNSGRKTHLAIDEGAKLLRNVDNRPGVPKAMVIFVGDHSDSYDLTIAAAESAKSSNITIFVISVDDRIDLNMLKLIASRESFIIRVRTYDYLIQFIEKINSRTCSVPQTPDIGSKVEADQLQKYEKRYFKFQLPNEGITIKIDNREGNTQGYYSYTIENPSSAMNDGEFTSDVFIAPRKIVNGRIKRDVGYTSSVYLTIKGQEDNNVYSLETIEGKHTCGGGRLQTSMLSIITCFILFINFF